MMHSRRLLTIVTLLLLALLASACGLLKEPEEASAPIEAVPLDVETDVDEPEPEANADTAEDEADQSEDQTAQEDEAEAEAPSGLQIYTISQADSEVRFDLDEDLRGQRNTVVGVTDQVAGEIAVDLGDLSTTQLGVIQVNARTLATDNNFRNRAISNEILDTGEFEFITFTPTAVNGLSGAAAIGEEVSFSVEGDLTIRDITQAVTFQVVATAVSESQISGTATAVVTRESYGLTIPSVRDVANVEEEVNLTIDFVANAS
jgi:polyisoprenoid-binding protein YceI